MRILQPLQQHLHHRLDSVWTLGIVLLVVTKVGDIVTTLIGLHLVDGLTEQNPFAASVIEIGGLVGLVAVSVVAVGLVVLVAETVVSWLDDMDDVTFEPMVLYCCSYIPLATVFGFATIHNVVLIIHAI